MRHSLPIAPQFYVTAQQPCPYLDGREERKLFTALNGEDAEALNNSLSKQGFRRSQNVLYRPSCPNCTACYSARIRVADFIPSKSQKRCLKKNSFLTRSASSPWASEEQYDLFRTYLASRHADGGMADMDIFEFAAMVEETPIKSRIVEYTQTNKYGKPDLAAVCLTDVFDDGLSMVYSFFDPDLVKNSLGTYIILDHIAIARDAGLPYVYLGYWVPTSPKMAYKAKFSALEIYQDGDWRTLDNPDGFDPQNDPMSVDPIAEQVAKISLPNTPIHRG